MLDTNIDPSIPQAEPTPLCELTLVRANEEQILAFHKEAYKIWSFGLSFDVCQLLALSPTTTDLRRMWASPIKSKLTEAGQRITAIPSGPSTSHRTLNAET